MNRIKELRQIKGLTQKELAGCLSVSDSTLSYWERGNYEPDHNNLIKLADYFNVTTDYLLGRDNRANPEKSQATPNATDFLRQYYYDRTGRYPTPDELIELDRIADTYIKGMGK